MGWSQLGTGKIRFKVYIFALYITLVQENSYCPIDSVANCDTTLALSTEIRLTKGAERSNLSQTNVRKVHLLGNYSAVLNGH